MQQMRGWVLVGMLAMAAAGCGTTAPSGLATPPVSPYPTPAHGSCGSISMPPRLTVGSPAQDALCFQDAALTCKKATLTISSMGVDAGTVSTYSIDTASKEVAGTCPINVSVLSFVVAIHQSRSSFTCQTIQATPLMLTLSGCSKTPIVRIPLPTPSAPLPRLPASPGP